MDNIKNPAHGPGSVIDVSMARFAVTSALSGVNPIAPAIRIVNQGDQKMLQVYGAAVFGSQGNNLAGYLTPDETIGCRWFSPDKKQIKGGLILIPCLECPKPIAIQILRGSGSFKPKIVDGNIVFNMKVNATCNYLDQSCLCQVLTPQNIRILEQKTNAVIKKQVLACVKKSQLLNSDIFGFGIALSRAEPDIWAAIKNDWAEITQMFR